MNTTATTALARRNGVADDDLVPPGSPWTAADVALIRALVAPKATDQEFKLLLHLAVKYGLDPLARQIYCIKYGDKPAQIFAGRDGFLAIAHRSGAFDGMQTIVRVEQAPLVVEYVHYENGQRRTGTFRREWQYVATTTVWHKGMAHPITVEVWEEEYSSGQNLWATKPRTMITKVGECQALRRAFNISGLYDPAEVEDQPIAPRPDNPPAAPPTHEVLGEAREVTADNIPAGRVVVAVGEASGWEALARRHSGGDDEPAGEREALYARLKEARAALDLSQTRLRDSIQATYGQEVQMMDLAQLERVVERYEREAADRGQPAGVAS